MFNSVTADRLKHLPPVEGVDRKRIPQILSKVYAHIVGLRSKYDAGASSFAAEEIEEDYNMLSDLAFTLELYLESGRFEDKNDAIAFVAAISHKLMSKLKTQKPEALTAYSIPSDMASVLLFVIGGYITEAEEESRKIKRVDGESDVAWRLKQDINLLVRGKPKEIIEAKRVKPDEATLEQYAQDLLWEHISMGIISLSELLIGRKSSGDFDSYFAKVVDLATFVDQKTGHRYDYPGISRLARLLRMVSRLLIRQSVIDVVSPYLTTSGHYETILELATNRPFLWRNHIDAIEKGFLKEGISSVITFPTGAGKSTLVELKIIQHVAIGGKVVYIVPTHALEYQVKNDIARLLGIGDYKHFDIGREFTLEEEDDLPVIVTTPERCSTLLALNPKSFEGVTLVVMDEFHIIGEDGHRSLGAMYCIISLLTIVPDADYIMVSAMVENGDEIADWLKDVTGRKCLNLSLAWKPTSQLQGCIVYQMEKRKELQALADKEKQNRGKRKCPSVELKRRLFAEPYCLFSLCNTWESDDAEDYYLTPMLDHQVQLGVNCFWKLTGNRNHVSKELAKKFAATGLKTIVFVENPVQANSLVKQLNEDIGVEDIPAELRERLISVTEEFGDKTCSYIKEKMGAVPHHALLLAEERRIMESLFRRRSDIMIATPTLAQGVNLPVDVVLIAGEDRYDADKEGRDRMEAHEILNAAGRAGRAGFRSQGAAIIVSNSVIGIEENELTDEWFELKREVFSKGDRCLSVEDPFGKMVIDGGVSAEQKLVLMKLNLAGESKKKMLSKTLCAYQLKQKHQDVESFEERIMMLSSQYDDEVRTPLMELSLKTGVDKPLLDSFYGWLKNVKAGTDFGAIELLDFYCSWLVRNPEALRSLLTYDRTITFLKRSFGSETFDGELVKRLRKVLRMYIEGCPLKAISAQLNEKSSDENISMTRAFVLKVLPEMSYAFSVMTMVHIQYLIDNDWGEIDIPLGIKNFSTYLKEGVLTEDMLRFKAERKLMRVETHRLYAIN